MGYMKRLHERRMMGDKTKLPAHMMTGRKREKVAKRPDDTNEIPEKITAPWVKRFFKAKLGIPVMCENVGRERGWVGVRIPCDNRKDFHGPITYSHRFPEEFGNRCMRLVYPDSESLSAQNWGGNINSTGIALEARQFRALLQGLLDNPIELNQEVA